MVTISAREPFEFIAGDTVKWRREDLTADYPADDGWTLAYRIVGKDDGLTAIEATADGAAFAVTISAAETAHLAAGVYQLAGRVAKDGDQYTVYQGTLRVRQNVAGLESGNDTRSHARKVLDAIEAVIEKRATKDQESYTIEGRTLARTPIEALMRLRQAYRAEVKREERAERIAQGLGTRAKIKVRFGR